MSFMAWLMVWQAPLVPMPQQAVASLPLVASTVSVTPRAPQHVVLATSQKSPVPQLVLSVQVVRQAVGPQMKLSQEVGRGIGQLPVPSQTVGLCWVPLLQLASVVPQAIAPPG
jgi:hypothetical protein